YAWHKNPQPPVLTGVRPGHGRTVPFLALAEAFVLNAFRKAGLPMNRIRPAVDMIKKQYGLEYALARQEFVTDGAEILRVSDDPFDQRLIVVRNHQAVFNDVVKDYLQHIDFGRTGFAEVIRLPQYTDATVTVRPTMNAGRPTLGRGGVSVDAVLGRLRAGEPAEFIADDYGYSLETIQDLNRQAA
ncbi:MAG TPA: hypothetical protein VGC79_13145, partial [Polyangiaceae bacterium]